MQSAHHLSPLVRITLRPIINFIMPLHQSDAAPTAGLTTKQESWLFESDVLSSLMNASHDFALIIDQNGDSHDPDAIICNR